MSIIKKLLSLVLLFSSFNVFAQLDTLHYLPPIHGVYANNSLVSEEIHLSTPSVTNIIVNVTNGAGVPFGAGNGTPAVVGQYIIRNGNPGLIVLGVAPTAPVSILDTEVGMPLNGTRDGVVLSSTGEFYVNYRGLSNPHAGALTSKGQAGIGRHFKWAAPPQASDTSNARSIISFFAVENTTVTVSDLNPAMRFF